MIEIEFAMNEYMSVSEAAEYLGLNRQRIYQLIQDDVLTVIRLGKTRVVLTSEIEELRKTHTKYKHYHKK